MEKLYSAIVPSPVVNNTDITVEPANPNLVTVSPTLYSSLVPEKPSILAEERIFVYVPKASYDNAGIAKFATDQFTILDTEVSLNSEFIQELKEWLAKPDMVVSVDTPADSQLWYKDLGKAE